MPKQTVLTDAKHNKKDEFYTQLSDIEKELRYYKKHFEDKVVFCNCDDPYESNFFRYFALNFNRLKLKKLICTSYVSSPIRGTIFEYFEENESEKKPYKAIVTKVHDVTGDGAVDMFDVAELFKIGENQIEELQGDGDFRSEECIELLKESDIVVTNPPFSLFREYVAQLMEYKKDFLVIGNINCITYKEIFPLLMENKAWLGNGMGRWISGFIVPDSYELYGTEAKINDKGQRIVATNNCLWLTNLDIKKRHEELILVKKYSPKDYPKYENYEAIEVSKTKDIPCDYKGVMGVPITFMDKYSPDQFEIIGHPQSNILPDGWQGVSQDFVDLYYKQGNKGQISAGWINPVFISNEGKAVVPYQRILIRNKHPEEPRE